MKYFYSLTITLLLASFSSTFAQKLDNEHYSPWFIGANVGATWHNTDVKNKTHYGWGLALGRTFNRMDGNFMSFDVKLRYLGGAWRGQDFSTTNFTNNTNATLSQDPTNYKQQLGYAINNFQTKAHELNLEFSMHFNRFTERTGFDPYIFTGIGTTLFRTKGDLLDDEEQMYEYDNLHTLNSKEIKSFLNNDYESNLDGSEKGWQAAIMPHLGIGLGYYFTPNLSLGIEHKTSFSRDDRFDGFYSNKGKFNKDIYHYTNLYLKVYLKRARTSHNTTPPPPVAPPVTPPVTNNPCPLPILSIQTASNLTVNHPEFSLNGVLQNANLSAVQSTLNGIQTGNLVQSNNQNFRGSYNLQQGLNTIVLTVRTECGADSKTIHVNYVPACDQPLVQFTNPRSNASSTTSPTYTIQAQIGNLGNGLIEFFVNGNKSSNYTYNSQTGLFTSTVALQNGSNTIQIIASNNCGSKSEVVTISYDKVCPSPIFTNIGQTVVATSSKQIDFTTYIRNVSNANQIELWLNGRAQSNGSYSTSTEKFTKSLTLNSGRNTITVRVTNSCGTIENTWNYDYNEPCFEPTVQFTNPSGSRVTSSVSYYTIQASLTNITNPQNIQLKVNGNIISNFNYNIQNGLLTANIQLNTGSNYVEITSQNACGTANASVNISYTAPCEKPVITFKNPINSNGNATQANYLVEVNIGKVNSINNIQFYWNGTLQTGGSFNANTGVFSAMVQLQKGNNAFQVVATNNCGQESAASNINYKGDVVVVGTKPDIQFNNVCNVKQKAGLVSFFGKIEGVTNTSQIVVKVQNSIYSDVQYTPITNGFAFTVNFNVGYSQTVVMEIITSNHVGTTTRTCQILTEDPPIIDIEIEICHTVNGVKQTLIIKQSQWETYQKMGATLGKCPVIVDNDLVICLKGITLTIKESQWSTFEAQGAKKGACPEAVDNDIVICLPKGKEKITLTIKESEWETYRKMGATLGKCPEVIDNDMVICIQEGRIKVTKVIKESEWAQYQALGATLGECPVYDPEITICVRVGNSNQTMVIKQSEWPKYQAQGAFVGECPVVVDPDITICSVDSEGRRQTIVIKQSQWSTYQAQGATMGACKEEPVKLIDICLPNGKEMVSMKINENMWPDYQKLGATKGKCPVVIEKEILICVLEGKIKVTKMIKESQLESYLQMGATLGTCPPIVDNDIVICLPQGKDKVTMTIKESQWDDYKKMGATLGKCPVIDNDIVICLPQGKDKVTMTIKESQWENYRKQGATLGKCPEVVDEDMTICVREGRVMVTKVIKKSEWPAYQVLGAQIGACPVYDPEFHICIDENGVKRTIIIKESQWAAYQAQGAKIGVCAETTNPAEQDSMSVNNPSNDMLICMLENGVYVTKTIRSADWGRYEKLGATRGACTNVDGIKVAPSKRPTPTVEPNIKTEEKKPAVGTKPATGRKPVDQKTTSGGRTTTIGGRATGGR